MLRILSAALLTLWFCACSSTPRREPAIGEAFVGPSNYQVRTELTSRAEVAATVSHGERLEIIGRRRRFLKVRTASGAEGWLDSRLLLSTEEMRELQELARRAASMPSLGAAGVFDALNVHTAPNRQAPSFAQIPANGHADVVWRQRVARTTFTPPEPAEAPPPTLVKRKKKSKQAGAAPPPRPKAPGVPDDWLAMSGKQSQPAAAHTPPPPAADVPIEDWTLVRLSDGRAGWVLSHMLFMAIPDEVAQYAERARIVTYFAVAEVRSKEGEVKPSWLWTTRASSKENADFDSARVFVYNTYRRRYETSYIERNLRGYLPVEVEPRGAKQAAGFSFVVEEKDGTLKRRHYAFQGQRVRLVRRESVELPAPVYVARERRALAAGADTPAPEESLLDRARSAWHELKARLRRE